MTDQTINVLNIPSLQTKKNISFKQQYVPPAAGNQALPAMQGLDKDGIQQSVDNSYIANRAKASQENDPMQTLGMAGATWYALSQGMDKINPMCEGKYPNTILGKFGGLGDKFSKNTWIGRKLDKLVKYIDVKTYKWSKNSQFLYSLRNHSTKPEWNFAKMPAKGLYGFLAMDAESVVEDFMKPIAARDGMFSSKNIFQGLEQYGMTQQEINNFAKSLDGLSFQEKALALQTKEIELLGADTRVINGIYRKRGIKGLQDFAESLKLKKLGFKSKKEYLALKGHFVEEPEKVLKMLKNAAQDPKLKVSIWRGHTPAGRVKGHFIGRTVSFTEYYNKCLTALGKGNKTRLGRAMSKSLGWFLEGCTNRFGGGKLAVFMQAFIFADMFLNTFKAPKGEKIKTLAERFVNDFSYVFAMTIGVLTMHKIGGFKKAGLSIKGAKEYDAALKAFNEKVLNGTFKNKKMYDAAKAALDKKLGLQNIKNPFVKILNKIGRIINMGNERILPYKSTKKLNMNWLRSLGNANILGVPLRLAIPLAFISPFIAKTMTKIPHAIFGRPTRSVLDDEPAEEQTEQLNLAQTQQAVPGPKFEGNLLDAVRNTPKESKNTYIPSPESKVAHDIPEENPESNESNIDTNTDKETDSANKEPIRSYIPSAKGIIIQEQDYSDCKDVISQADKVLNDANKLLKSINNNNIV